MSFLATLRQKCMLAASHAAPGESSTLSMHHLLCKG